MSANRTFVLALAVTAVAAGLAIQRRTRRQEAVRDEREVHAWENEGGNTHASEIMGPPPSPSH